MNVARRSSISRRRASTLALLCLALSLTLVGASSGATAGNERALVKIKYLLDFFANGTDAGFYVAVDKGFYRDAGFDVEISDGQGSASTAQAVAAGNADFGTVAASAHITAVAQGAPVKMLATFYQQDGSGILVSKDITKPKDLEGKTIVGTLGLMIPLFNAYVRNTGIDGSKVNVLTVAPSALLPTFLSGRANGCLCFAHSEAIRARMAGFKVNFLPFGEHGLTVLGQGIVVNTQTLREKPDLVRRFVRASLKGWAYAYDNPFYAAGVMQKMVKSQGAFTTAQTNVATLKAMKALRYTKATAGKPFGWMAPQDWATTVRALKDGGALPAAAPSAEALFTNQFVPPKPKPTKRK